jgi:hypothetical protein
MDVLSSFAMKVEFLFAIIEIKKPELHLLFVFVFVPDLEVSITLADRVLCVYTRTAFRELNT